MLPSSKYLVAAAYRYENLKLGIQSVLVMMVKWNNPQDKRPESGTRVVAQLWRSASSGSGWSRATVDGTRQF